jgi:hypothetical protein
MGYVMVPVPEEHVEEAMQLILRLVARSRLVDWEQDDLNALFAEVDEPTKSVLSAIAKSASSGSPMVDHALAESIELQQREVLGIIRELNERSQRESRGPLIIVRMENEVLPNGRTREVRRLDMDNDLALLVREAERHELAANPHPLLSDG